MMNLLLSNFKPKRSALGRPGKMATCPLTMASRKERLKGGNMKTTYAQDLQELNITAEEYDSIISHIYDKTAAEMVILAKAIKSGARVLPTVKKAFERVLDMRPEERKEAYEIYYSNLNTMCFDCLERGKSCAGTTCQTWTGCIYRKTK